MSDPDWNLIRSFLAVAETGSLSAAARRLSVSQPTLGRHVAELEAALGVVLFRRGRAGYELTEAGAGLVGRASAMAAEANGFLRLAAGRTERVAGTVRISASEIVSTCVLPGMLAELAVAEPEIEIELVASNRVENLLRRDADIAIRMIEPAQLDLVARKVGEVTMVACAARAYLEAHGRPRETMDLLDHAMIGFDRGVELVEGFRAFGIEIDRSAFRFRSDNHVVLWEAVKAGIGVGFAQRPLVARTPEVEAILPGLALPFLPVWLAMHRDVRSSLRIRRVADFLFEALRRYSAG